MPFLSCASFHTLLLALVSEGQRNAALLKGGQGTNPLFPEYQQRGPEVKGTPGMMSEALPTSLGKARIGRPCAPPHPYLEGGVLLHVPK